jgi:hypothetical protein
LRIAFLAVLVLASLPLEAQFGGFDRDLLDKLYRADFAHISDDNVGRMDLEAVVMAFRADDEVAVKCDLFGGQGLDVGQLATFLGYIKFLNTDRDTGTFPSAQFLALSVLGFGTDAPGLWALDPNMLAMGLEIEKGCASPRAGTIRRNLVRLLDERIEWYSKDQSARIPLAQQSTVRITQRQYAAAVERDVALPAQPQAMSQIAALESRGAQLINCEYGPTRPDSTGSQTLTLWYGAAPLTMNEFKKVSQKHPLGNFGDDAITACPPTLLDGRTVAARSLQKGRAGLDQAALAAVPASMDRLLQGRYPLFEATRAHWLAYQNSRQPGEQQQAAWGKAQLLKDVVGNCELTRRSNPPTDGGTSCAIEAAIRYEFQAVPDVTLTGRGRVYLSVDGTIVNPEEPIVAASNRADSPGLQVGLRLSVVTLEPIDLYSQDEQRRYKAQLAEPAVWRGQTVLEKGAEVMLTIQRSKAPQMPNVMTVVVYAVSVVYYGQPTPITTGGSPATIPAVQRGKLGQLAPQTPLSFSIQAPTN